MKLGRFIVDTHVHAMRHAVKFVKRELKATYATLGQQMTLAVQAEEATPKTPIVVYDNSARLLYDMECYGVDMCIR